MWQIFKILNTYKNELNSLRYQQKKILIGEHASIAFRRRQWCHYHYDLLLSRLCEVVDPYKIYPVQLHSIRRRLKNIPIRLGRISLSDREEILLCKHFYV